MINERIRKGIHCIEDSISRFDKKGDKQHYSFNESIYYFAVEEFSAYFQKLSFLDNIVKKLDFYYESSGVVESLNDVLFISSGINSAVIEQKVNYTILADRAESFVGDLFEVLPTLGATAKKDALVRNIKAFLPHIIKIEDYCSFIIYLAKMYKSTKNPKYLKWAQQKTEQYTNILYVDNDGLVRSGMDTTTNLAFPRGKYLLSACGYYLLGLKVFLENFETCENEKYKDIYSKICKRLLKLQKTNGYFNASDDLPVTGGDKKDSLATLHIAAAFFGGVRLSIIEDSYYAKAVKAFHIVIDDFKLKDGLLSMPNISDIGKIKRYFSINFNLSSTAYSDKESGLAALAISSVEYSKCADNKNFN